MAGEDYSVKTKVTADVSNFEKGMNKAEKSLKGFSNKLADNINRLGKKGLIGSIANVTLAMSGLTSSLSTVIKFAQQMGKAINECTEAYKGQVIAERALDTAIQNNPFITGSSSKALKEFASEMQKVSNYGDEQLIPMMTNLVSLGRTESETMQIMSVAMDMSAGMGISLDSAITQLNATLNGSIGRLGQQNAELKGLTEEELKQGKAIEILGEKFKGLSSATADTSKQLQNIKGDFKEALGQFTLPTSDMWNKFWAGFYEKGIEVLRKLDDYLDINTVGKKIFENIQDEAKKIAKSKKLKIGDVLGDFNFISEQLSGLSEKELSVLKKSLEGIKDRTDIEQYWLNMVSKRLHNIELEADQERANAKAEAERAKAEEARLAREKELAELRKKQAEERAKQLKVENQWQDKILDQQISMLEAEKSSAVEGAEERGEATYQIEREYNEKLLELRLQKVEKEREAELKAENVTAAAKIAINQYYDNEVKKIYDDLGKYKAKKNKEEVKETKKSLEEMLKTVSKTVQDISKKMSDTFSKVLSKIKSIFSAGVNLFKKLFEFKPDEALDNILKLEDSILTFFVETLPKTPNFFASVIDSINVLLQNISKTVKASDIRKFVSSIIKLIFDNLPYMIETLVVVMEELAEGLMEALGDWFEDDGLKKLLDLVIRIQKSVEKVVGKALTYLVDMFDKHKQDFTNFLAESIASANRTLPVLFKAILKLINALIEAIAGAFENQDFVDSIAESIEKTIDAFIKIIPKIIGSIIKLIFNIITAIIPKLPEIIMYVIQAIAEALPSMAGDIAGALGKGIGQIFSKIFTTDFWGDMFQNLGEVIVSILKSALGGFNIGGILGGGSSGGGGGSWWQTGLDIATGGVLGKLFGWAKGTNNAPAGLSIVGEAGPELVKFNGGEQVLNAHNTQKALEGMGGKTINQSITFNNLKDTTAFAMMQQMKAYNRQMAINGVI